MERNLPLKHLDTRHSPWALDPAVVGVSWEAECWLSSSLRLWPLHSVFPDPKSGMPWASCPHPTPQDHPAACLSACPVPSQTQSWVPVKPDPIACQGFLQHPLLQAPHLLEASRVAAGGTLICELWNVCLEF